MNNKDKNVLVLAYLGDSIYEVYIRNYLISTGIEKVKKLQEEAIKYVSAKNQAKFLNMLLDKNFFNEVELEILYRARNHKGYRHPKNTDIITYKHSTAFEAVIGYLFMTGQNQRLSEFLDFAYQSEI